MAWDLEQIFLGVASAVGAGAGIGDGSGSDGGASGSGEGDGDGDDGDAPPKLPGAFMGVGGGVALVFFLLCFKAMPRVGGPNAFAAVATAAAWGMIAVTQALFQVDMNDEIYYEAGNDPADAFEDLDADGLQALWPAYYWRYYIAATVFTLATYGQRTGYMGIAGKIRGSVSSTFLPRLPFVLIGLLMAVLVKGRAATLAEDSDDEGFPTTFKQLYGAWILLSLHCTGVVLGAILLGVGAGTMPRRAWVGTELQRAEKLKRERVKAQNQLVFATKTLNGLRKTAESERDAIPLSDPAYALYHSVIRSPQDPFYEAPDAGEIPPEEDTGEPPAVRKRRLLSTIRGVDHQAIAKMRRTILEASEDVRLCESEIEALDSSIEAIEASGRAGFSGRGFIGAVGAGISGALAAMLGAWFLLAPIADARELRPMWGLVNLFADPDNDDGGGKPFVYLLITLYMQVCVVAAVLFWRRWFYVYTISLDQSSHPGSIMRTTEILLYTQLPLMAMFSEVVMDWSWMLDDPAQTNLSKSLDRLTPFPLFGTMFTSIGCMVAGACVIATWFFNLPGRIQALRFRQAAYAQASDPVLTGTGSAGGGRKTHFAIFGAPIEGELLTAGGDFVGPVGEDGIPSSPGLSFQWSRKAPESPDPDPIGGANEATYMPGFDDIGFVIACTCENAGVTASAMASDKVRVAEPQIRDLVVQGGPYHSAPFKAVGNYVGGVEGASEVRWFKCKSGVTTPLPQADGYVFQPSIDEVAVTLSIEYTPVRQDGVRGETRTAESAPVKVDTVVGKRVRNHIVSGFAELEIKVDDPRKGRMDASVMVNDKHIRIARGGKVLYKDYLGTHVSCALSQADPHEFTVSTGTKDFNCYVDDHLERDVIALTIRSFAIMVSRANQKEAKKNNMK